MKRHANNFIFSLTILNRDVATGELTYMTHHKKFEQLIHIEEQQMEVDIRQYDMKGVTMEKYKENSRLLVLKVPGLSENRPSVLKGILLFIYYTV